MTMMRKTAIALLTALIAITAYAGPKSKPAPESDRDKWVEACYDISAPVLESMSRGELKKTMKLELSPTYGDRDTSVAYLEAFGRLMCGISPWLALPDDDTPEGMKRAQLRDWAIKAYQNAVDPESPDCLQWDGTRLGQPLVDAAFLAQSFLRAPEATWGRLDTLTQRRYLDCFKGLRNVTPAYNNWLLFRGIIEAFILKVSPGDADRFALRTTANKMNEWYQGGGMYSDGAHLALDNYNAFVIHPMYIEMIEQLEKSGQAYLSPVKSAEAVKRMQQYNEFVERLIAPDGTYPAFGRSVVYRLGALQTLAMAAWKYGYPKGLTDGSVRAALTAVMENMLGMPGTYDADGFLTLGYAGHQPEMANSYTNNGSVYLTSTMFLPLGLPADHPFWTAKAEPWTQQRIWHRE